MHVLYNFFQKFLSELTIRDGDFNIRDGDFNIRDGEHITVWSLSH